MKNHRERFRRALGFEQAEDRTLTTLIFVLNGNAFRPARPSSLTADAARVLKKAGHQAIQIATPEINSGAAFDQLARKIASIAHGRPIGIVGFSAGGSLAARLAGVAKLHVKAALDYYGPADFRDYLDRHQGDAFYRAVVGRVHFKPSAIRMLSGPIQTSAYVVGAFGLDDRNVVASDSIASFRKVIPNGQTYTYPGPHGASINASPPALRDFLAHV
ncbi:alpha/beta hydrolase family protein [Tundrisphaera lichenicola]|uniref:alpha/beta hydrolase family protein n=1 Tax=Tundrisphaera lichenicola TaxID=2029860 RepID=UPI003EB9B537